MERASGGVRRSRRSFVKAGIAGGAIIAGAALLKAAPITTAVAPAQGYPQYGSYLVWLDGDISKFRKTNLKTGLVEGTANSDAATVIQEAINALPPNDVNGNSVGGEIWLSTDVNDTDSTVNIDRSNVSLLAMRKTGPRNGNVPRPHVMKIQYLGKVRGGVLRGLNCRQIAFDGTDNQQQMSLENISLHPQGPAFPSVGLQFLGSVGYQQYINIHNLEITLDGTDGIGIEFANANNGSGHIDFSGHTIIATEAGAAGSPVGIRFSTGVETGTPIRFDNLSISDQGRSAGAALKPIYMQSQPTNKGLRQLNIKEFFFLQHYTSPNYLFTIDAATGPAWFIATVEELAVWDDPSPSVVYIVNNMNTQWMTREQLLRINSGCKGGPDMGGLALGVPNQHTYFRVYLGKISPFTPFGRLTNPFRSAANQQFVGAGGDSANPIAGTDYRVGPTPVAISGPGLTIKDPAANTIKTVTTATGEYVPTGYLVSFAQTTGYTVFGM